MAIVKCRECGNPVSEAAEKCPNCGISTPSKTNHIVETGIAIILMIVLIASFDKITAFFKREAVTIAAQSDGNSRIPSARPGSQAESPFGTATSRAIAEPTPQPIVDPVDEYQGSWKCVSTGQRATPKGTVQIDFSGDLSALPNGRQSHDVMLAMTMTAPVQQDSSLSLVAKWRIRTNETYSFVKGKLCTTEIDSSVEALNQIAKEFERDVPEFMKAIVGGPKGSSTCEPYTLDVNRLTVGELICTR